MNLIESTKNFPATKSEQEALVNGFIANVLVGIHDPVEVEIAMATMENIVKLYRKDNRIKSLLVDIVEKEGGKITTPNATISLTETAVEYDYTDSKTWREASRVLDQAKERIKQIETALKNATELNPFIDGEGEDGKIYNINKTSKRTITVKINK